MLFVGVEMQVSEYDPCANWGYPYIIHSQVLHVPRVSHEPHLLRTSPYGFTGTALDAKATSDSRLRQGLNYN